MGEGLLLLGGDFLEDEDILAVLLETDGVGLDVPKYPVEVVLVDAQEVAVVFAQNYRGCSVWLEIF